MTTMPPPTTAMMRAISVSRGAAAWSTVSRAELGLLGERPPGDYRCDSKGHGDAREPEGRQDEPERRDARRSRHDHGGKPRAGDQLTVERMGVALQDAEPGEREQAGDRAGGERAPPIRSHEGCSPRRCASSQR